MRDIVSPLMGLRSPFGGRVDPYKAAGFRPTLVAGMTRDYYRSTSRQTFDDLFTHSRLGNATMVDSDGLLKWGPHNLLTYSEQFDNAAWVVDNSGSTDPIVTSDYAASPDGSSTADRIQFDKTGGTFSRILQGAIGSGVIGETYTFSVWLKTTDGLSSVNIGYQIGLGKGYFSVTNEWQIFSATYTIASTSRTPSLLLWDNISQTPDTADILVWGAHVYRSDLGGMAPVPVDARVAGSTTYVPTTSTAKYLPRRHNHVYSGTAWVDAGTLIETEARTNLVTYSEDFTDASWTNSTAVMTVTANAGVSPSGQSDATLFTPDTATNIRYAGVSGFPSSDYTFSIYAKSNGGSNDQISIWLAGFTQRAVFDLGAGTVNNINLTSASIEDVGNGWYRCVGYSSTATTAARVYLQDGNAFTGNDSDGVYLWGAQLE